MSVNNINHSSFYCDTPFSIHQHHFESSYFVLPSFKNSSSSSILCIPFLTLFTFQNEKERIFMGGKSMQLVKINFCFTFSFGQMSLECLSAWRPNLMLMLHSVFSLMFQCLNLKSGKIGKVSSEMFGL